MGVDFSQPSGTAPWKAMPVSRSVSRADLDSVLTTAAWTSIKFNAFKSIKIPATPAALCV